MWLDSSPSVRARSYLDSVLEELTDVTCPTFHYVGQTHHRLVRVSLRFAKRPSLAGYWKLNASLLEIRDFQDRLESLIHWVLIGAFTSNIWWGSFKHRIRDFAIKYGHQLNLDRTKVAKSLEDKLSRAVEGGFSRRDLECDASKHYLVRSRLKRVSREAVKCNPFAREEEVQRFPFRYIDSVKFPGGHVLRLNHEMHEAARCPDLPVQVFPSYLADFPRFQEAEVVGCEGLITKCEVRDSLKQVSLNKL